jgi:hypothetical protein
MTGIYDDLFKNDLWVTSAAVYLHSQMNQLQELISPGKMLAYTTIAIAADRYGQNANKQILEDSVEKKTSPPDFYLYIYFIKYKNGPWLYR